MEKIFSVVSSSENSSYKPALLRRCVGWFSLFGEKFFKEHSPNTLPMASVPSGDAYTSLSAGCPGVTVTSSTSSQGGSAVSVRPLRVVRVQDVPCVQNRAGRLWISGRMADVCAELERLSERHPEMLH